MNRVAGGLLLLAACARSGFQWPAAYARTHPETAYAAAASLTQGCPFVGAPAGGLSQVWGRPAIRLRRDSTIADWDYELRDGVMLTIAVQADTVVTWDVAGTPTARHARAHFAWSLAQARNFPARVAEYLVQQPQVEPRTAFLLFRGCPQPGLPAAAVGASWGAPSAVVASSDTTLWIYGYGVEGQHETIAIVADTVRAYQASQGSAPAASRQAGA